MSINPLTSLLSLTNGLSGQGSAGTTFTAAAAVTGAGISLTQGAPGAPGLSPYYGVQGTSETVSLTGGTNPGFGGPGGGAGTGPFAGLASLSGSGSIASSSSLSGSATLSLTSIANALVSSGPLSQLESLASTLAADGLSGVIDISLGGATLGISFSGAGTVASAGSVTNSLTLSGTAAALGGPGHFPHPPRIAPASSAASALTSTGSISLAT